MNCRTLRDGLLAALNPAKPGSAARRHLLGCADCRAWHARLVALEGDLRQLPVPPALDAKASLLHAIQQGPEQVAGVIRLIPPVQTTPKERGLRKLAISVALVAALALFALGYAVWPHHGDAVDPLAGRYAERDRRLAAAQSPKQRVQAIAGLSEEVRREALGKGDKEQTAHLVKFYDHLVREDLPACARDLAEPQRSETIYQVIDQLREAEKEIDQLASDSGIRSESMVALAAAARDGQVRLRAML
jgi:hypothetical protein